MGTGLAAGCARGEAGERALALNARLRYPLGWFRRLQESKKAAARCPVGICSVWGFERRKETRSERAVCVTAY